MNAAADDIEISPVPPERAAEAFRLVFDHLAADDRARQIRTLLAGVRSGEVPPEGLLGARRGGRLVGAVFSRIQPGKTAVLWCPRLVSGEPASTASALLAAACEPLADGGLSMVHVLLERVAPSDDALLRGGGFERLARLLYLVSLQAELPSKRPSGPLEFEPYSAANHDRLVRLVEATYRETLDCPRLNGIRRIEDVLAGYRATGVFAPQRWLIVRHQGQDVGCLLLADHPEPATLELVYMGLLVSVRGHGWGRHIARHAQWLTGRCGRPRLVLAVDAENAPAIAMYAAVGFRAWDKRTVYVRVFGPSA